MPKKKCFFYSSSVISKEAVVEAMDVSIDPWMVNDLASKCVLPVWTLVIYSMFVLSANEHEIGQNGQNILPHHVQCTYILV